MRIAVPLGRTDLNGCGSRFVSGEPAQRNTSAIRVPQTDARAICVPLKPTCVPFCASNPLNPQRSALSLHRTHSIVGDLDFLSPRPSQSSAIDTSSPPNPLNRQRSSLRLHLTHSIVSDLDFLSTKPSQSSAICTSSPSNPLNRPRSALPLHVTHSISLEPHFVSGDVHQPVAGRTSCPAIG
jgi:hypothetical protein